MTILRNPFTFALLVGIATGAAPALAQQGSSPVYLLVDYMDVEPEKGGEYLDVEQQIWKPIHQERVKAGNILSWNLYAVRFPGGTENGYNFATVQVYSNLGNIENAAWDGYFARAHPERDSSAAAEMMDRTLASRDLVRSELWVLLDQAADTASADTSAVPSRYALIDFMRVEPGGEEAYLNLERDLIKPVHQERVKEGKIDSWGVYGLMLPSGIDYGYNYGTVNFFDSLIDLENPYPEDLITRVHEGADLSELTGKVYAARDLVRSELWELVDYTE